ncbi:MAG TPA: hypothetical protein VMN36_02630 [Verrucomicrobiales bacterium]|nr:hypothetical protein [Verrucomicrobiales bacterium]
MRLSPQFRWVWVGLWLFSLVAGAALAQEPEADEEFEELDALRERFERDLEAADLPVYQAFLEELQRIESAAAAREDYEAANQAKQRRLEVREMLGTPGSGLVKWREEAAITLNLEESRRRSASVQWNPREAVLGRWKTPGSEVLWNLSGLDPQVYEVEVTYSCGKTPPVGRGTSQPPAVQAGGVFEFGEVTALLEGSGKPIRHEVRPTRDWDEYRVELTGSLEIKATIAQLRLSAVLVEGDALMQVKRIRLIPSRPRGSPRPSVRDLTALEASFRETVATRGSQVRDAYLRDLEIFEARARAENDLRLAERIAVERKSVLEEPLISAFPDEDETSAASHRSGEAETGDDDEKP